MPCRAIAIKSLPREAVPGARLLWVRAKPRKARHITEPGSRKQQRLLQCAWPVAVLTRCADAAERGRGDATTNKSDVMHIALPPGLIAACHVTGERAARRARPRAEAGPQPARGGGSCRGFSLHCGSPFYE